MNVVVAGEQFELLPQKAIHWKAKSVLLLADMHLGKVNHFRKSGIPVPVRANDKNIEQLIDVIQATNVRRVICLGDLFHSHYNPEWEVFGQLVRHFESVSFELVQGNHDIMGDLQYKRKGVKVYRQLMEEPFLLTHHPAEETDGFYNLAGHVHPGVQLLGKGKQAETLPCFYFGEKQGFLPAFGMFTGLARLTPRREDKVFVIAGQSIFTVV